MDSREAAKELTRGPWFILLVCYFVVCALFIVSTTQPDTLPNEASGTYNHHSGIIKAKSHGEYPKDIQRTCSHEIGHYIWYELLTESEREEYRKINNETKDYISFYALYGGVEEDFAETFEVAVQCGYYPELVPDDRENFFGGPVFEAWKGERNHAGWEDE